MTKKLSLCVLFIYLFIYLFIWGGGGLLITVGKVSILSYFFVLLPRSGVFGGKNAGSFSWTRLEIESCGIIEDEEH